MLGDMITVSEQPSVWKATAAVVGLIAFVFYAATVSFLTLTDTCTMGGKGLLPEFMIGVPLASVASLPLVLSGTARSLSIQVGVGATTLLFLLYLVPQIFAVSIMGHHYCGAEYDAYLEDSPPFERWLPVGQLILVATVVAIAIRPWARRHVA